MARYISLYSGSSGNCSVVEENGKFILIDVGKSARATNNAIKELGLDVKNLQGILVTHEHSDHVAGLKVFLKKLDVPVYTAAPTADYLAMYDLVPSHIKMHNIEESGINVGSFFVKGFEIPHDAVCCLGYRITNEKGGKMAIATDLGHVTQTAFDGLNNVDLAIVESNYDDRMLKYGPYPYYLKERISSENGHLSNLQSSETTLQLIENGVKKLHLCHLSNNNNTPSLALEQLRNRALSKGIKIGDDAIIKVNSRNNITDATEF